MAGAAILASLGATRSGAGLVRIGTVASQQAVMALRAPLEVTSEAFAEDRYGRLQASAWPKIAKAIDAPVFHVNGDDVEALNFVWQLAADFRAEFKKDVVIDMVCYRKQGHNETDQPFFTQPLMYKKIAEQPQTLDIYTKKLLDEKTFTKEDIDEILQTHVVSGGRVERLMLQPDEIEPRSVAPV